MTLAGRTAVITGASSGIGQAVAMALAREGAEICAVGRRADALRSLVRQIHDEGAQARFFKADLSVEDEIKQLPECVSGSCAIHILVHCAGVIYRGPIAAASVEDLDRQYQVNVRGSYLLTQLLLPSLKAAQGDIIFINSSCGLSANTAQISQYAATKHALRAIADTLRQEVNADGIRVVSVYPGQTATPMQAELYRLGNKQYRPELLLQPEDVAATVLHALTMPRTAEITDISIRPFVKPC